MISLIDSLHPLTNPESARALRNPERAAFITSLGQKGTET